MKISQELGDKSGVSKSLHQLGMLAQDTGDLAEARRLYQESMKISQELGDKSGIAITLAQSVCSWKRKKAHLDKALELIRQAEVHIPGIEKSNGGSSPERSERLEKKAGPEMLDESHEAIHKDLAMS